MITRGSTFLALSALCWTASAFGAAADPQPPSQNTRPPLDPNQRVCEDITQVGSRLATKRICATRAEWAERAKQDKETLELARNRGAIPCAPINPRNPTQGSC